MTKSFWVYDIQTTWKKGDGTEEVIEAWYRPGQKFQTLEAAMKNFIYNDCDYDKMADDFKFEFSQDGEEVIMKGRKIIVANRGWKADRSEMRKFEQAEDKSKWIVMLFYAKFTFVQEEGMTMDEVKQLEQVIVPLTEGEASI